MGCNRPAVPLLTCVLAVLSASNSRGRRHLAHRVLAADGVGTRAHRRDEARGRSHARLNRSSRRSRRSVARTTRRRRALSRQLVIRVGVHGAVVGFGAGSLVTIIPRRWWPTSTCSARRAIENRSHGPPCKMNKSLLSIGFFVENHTQSEALVT